MKGDEADVSSSPQNIVPLRTILRNFLNLVDNCEHRRNGEADLYDKEFQELKQFSESLKSDSYYYCKAGEKNVNRKKNRYKDILPFDYSRVLLSDAGDAPGSDYVNANFIKGASGSSAYIACQGPLPHTVNDFWRTVVECEVQVIVMACMEQESGKHKCENYWVEEDGVEREFGDVTVWLKKSRNVCSDFLVRTMRIRFPNSKGEIEERNVCQFHYSAWPDHGVPTKVRPLLDMVRLIRDCQTSETLPVLIHCSAGCGRTGTICAIDYVWGLLRLGKLTQDFSLFNLVREMRRQRIAMVQTKDQYILVHRAVKELFQEQLKIIEAHPYANVDKNGLPLEIRQEFEEPTYETIEIHSRSSKCSLTSSCENPTAEVLSDNNGSQTLHILSFPSSKLKKETENYQKHENEFIHGSEVSLRPKRDYVNIEHLSPHLRKGEDSIESCLPNGVDTVDSSHFPVTTVSKVPVLSSSPTRVLLWKPSIVKLKALFEKSPKQEKVNSQKTNVTSTGLNRAKSDLSASSRLYSFTSSFSAGSRGVGSSSSSSLSITVTPPDRTTCLNPTENGISKSKPPIMTKPVLPVKRCKSLKIHSVESHKSPVSSLVHSQSPIKVCVKHREMPKLQSVIPSSLKYQIPSATSETRNSEVPSSRREYIEPLINSSLSKSESLDSPSPFKKPVPPSKTHIPLPTRSNEYVNRMKVTDKDMNLDFSNLPILELRQKKNNLGIPKSVLVVGSVTSCPLTRSQSHIWQPAKGEPELTTSIFYNEEISCTSEPEKTDKFDLHLLEHNWSKEKKGDVGSTHLENGGISISPLLGNPIVRKRMPNSLLYTNYPIDIGSSTAQGGTELGRQRNGHFRNQNYTSDSSNSLPSTPTQSIDRLYPQLRNFRKTTLPQGPPPKSTLKGSLSSTSSGSDERVDTPRSQLSGTLSNNTSIVTITNTNLPSNTFIPNTGLSLGVRERRNSFRQAVWKESQSDSHQSHEDSQNSFIPPLYLNASALCQSTSIHSATKRIDGVTFPILHRAHKDYEPIWPSEGTNTAFYRAQGQESYNSFPNGHLQPLTTNSGPLKSRFDDFKNLLDELKGTMVPYVNFEPKPPSSITSNNLKGGISSNLKHHRSLKAPSRSDYEHTHPVGGMSTLSCFTFKKPSSLESITDQLQTDSFGGKKTTYAFLRKEIPPKVNSLDDSDSGPFSTSFHSGRYANDYVTLNQCKTEPSCGFRVESVDEVDLPSRRPRHRQSNRNLEITVPVPPPRTKAKRGNQRVEPQDASNWRSDNTRGTNEKLLHTPDNQREKVDSTPSNVFVDVSDNRRNSRESTNVNSSTTSPLSMTRAKAIGMFQDMKSKFSSWTEPMGKERTQSQSSISSSGNQSKPGSGHSNDSISPGSREITPHGSHVEGNGYSPIMKPTTNSSRSTPKHQYL